MADRVAPDMPDVSAADWHPSPLTQPVPPSCHWKIRTIHEYWLAKHPGDGRLPGRQHLDPVEVPKLLPNLWLIDVVGVPPRFRFRLIGTEVIEYAGEDNTGRWFDEVWPDYDPAVFVDVVRTHQPSWTRGRSMFRPYKDYFELERVRLPLARNGRDVDMILALTVFYDRDGKEIFQR